MAIGKLLGSSAVGSVIGWVGGWLQRRQDLEVLRLEMADRPAQRQHELALRADDRETLRMEAESRERVASIETEGRVESAQLDAIAAGYASQFDGGGRIATFSSFIRPFTTMYFLIVSSVLTGVILWLAHSAGALDALGVDRWYGLVEYVVLWVLFHASIAIGWWFAMRAGQVPQLRVGR